MSLFIEELIRHYNLLKYENSTDTDWPALKSICSSRNKLFAIIVSLEFEILVHSSCAAYNNVIPP